MYNWLVVLEIPLLKFPDNLQSFEVLASIKRSESRTPLKQTLCE